MGSGDGYTGFRWEIRGKGEFEKPGADGGIILRWIFRKFKNGFMDCIELAQNMDRCWALVNAVLNLRVM